MTERPETRDGALVVDTWRVLDAHEANVVETMTARIMPSEPHSPGAREARVVRFIDGALADAAANLVAVYREGVRLLETVSQVRHGHNFCTLDNEDQDALLGDIDAAAATDGLTADQSRALCDFFATVHEHTIQGMFCDPEYGGNAGAVGWKLVGFPGAQWGYDAEQMRPDFDASTIPVVTLADLRRSLPKLTGRGEQVTPMTKRVEAIVVGLGASGGIIAEQLTAAGVYVVALEKGPMHGVEEFQIKHDEVRYYSRGGLVPQLSTDPVTWRPNEDVQAQLLPWATGALGNSEPLHLPPSVGPGGGTLHWGGASWRHRDIDFRMRSAIEDRFGPDALPENSTMIDWPIGYADLEPYYDRVEWELGVSGRAGNLDGEVDNSGNPFESPRRRGYPMPPLRRAAADERFVRASRELGYQPCQQPAAVASRDYNSLSACVYCGFCHGYLCHVGAKQSSRVTSVEKALATGKLDLRTRARVFSIDRAHPGGRVTGVSYFESDGTVRHIESDVVVLACYALENSRLLLASGINANGEVGQHFMTHSFGWCTAVLPEYTNPFMAPLVAASAIDDLNADGVPDNEDGVLWGSVITSIPGDLQPIEAAHNLPPGLPRWGKEFKHWFAENYRRLFGIHNQVPSFPSRRHYCDLDPRHTDAFGQPALRITHDWSTHDLAALRYFEGIKRRICEQMGASQFWSEPTPPPYHLSTHEVGTHRMGEDPDSSVVDVHGHSHECAGLYVVGGGQFPTLSGYNPTQTIQALAYLTADRILGRR